LVFISSVANGLDVSVWCDMLNMSLLKGIERDKLHVSLRCEQKFLYLS